MAKIVTKTNPAFGGVPEQSFSYGVPEEGEIVRQSGDDLSDFYLLQGGKLSMLDPNAFMSPEELDPAFGKSGQYVTTGQLRSRAADWLKQSGISIGEISVGDTLRDLGQRGVSRLGKEQFLTQTPFDINAFNQQMVSGGAIAPENSIAGIQSVFGADWTPSPAFDKLQSQGIFGAVRIAGTNEVYTIGSGGRKETAESYRQRFGTDSQEGIVGEISKEQALKLGVTDTGQTPVAPPGAITPEDMETTEPIDLTGTGETTNEYTADTTNAGINKNVETYNASKSDREKELETEVGDITTEMKSLLEEADEGRGAAQLTAEEKEEVKAKQQATDDAYAELEAKEAEIGTLTATYQLKNQVIEGKPITMGSIQGQQAQEYKMYLAQKNLLTSQASSLQAKAFALEGKLNRAQDAADRSVDLKYADIQQRFNNQVALYDIAKGELTEEQNIRLASLEQYTNQQQTILDYQIDEEKALNKEKLDLIGKYLLTNVGLGNTLQEINAAAQGTAIYRQQTRLAGGGGGGGTEPEPDITEPTIEPSLTAAQVRDIKYLPDPPQWFRQKWEKKLGWRIPQPYPTRIQEEWDRLRTEQGGGEDELNQLINKYING